MEIVDVVEDDFDRPCFPKVKEDIIKRDGERELVVAAHIVALIADHGDNKAKIEIMFEFNTDFTKGQLLETVKSIRAMLDQFQLQMTTKD